MSEAYISGIDVSRWQGLINWEAVAEDGIKFAFVKCGGSDCGFYTDPMWERNITEAAAAGILCGAYYYVGPNCVSMADGYADGLRAVALCLGKPVELPIVIDFEAPTAGNKAGNTAAVLGFYAAVREAGYKGMVYASEKSGFSERLNLSMLQDIPIWAAKWSPAPPASLEWEVWQNTSEAYVDGISGPVDHDFMTAAAWKKYTEPEAGELPAALEALRVAIDAVIKLL